MTEYTPTESILHCSLIFSVLRPQPQDIYKVLEMYELTLLTYIQKRKPITCSRGGKAPLQKMNVFLMVKITVINIKKTEYIVL